MSEIQLTVMQYIQLITINYNCELYSVIDTVGWVIRPVKTVGRITYIVLVQT